MSALALLPLAARAQATGHYSGPVYSGGDYSNPNNNPYNPPLPRVLDSYDSNGNWGGGTGAAYGYDPSSNQPFSGASDCGAAPITAIFTWTHANSSQTDQNDPPPPVIVTETTNSGWQANEASATGDYSNPYSCPTALSSTGYGISETGTHYSMKPGASSLPLTVTLTASSSGTGSSSASGVHYANDFVAYSAVVSPVTLTLGGVLRDSSTGNPILDSSGNQQILIGQGCGAGVSGIPSGNGWSVTYQWSVGGTTFQDWQPASASNSQASFYDPGPGVQTNSTYHWFWNDPTPKKETVTCTATVTPPAGMGSSFSVTATQNVMVYVPTVSKNTNSTGAGYIVSFKTQNGDETDMDSQPSPPMRNFGQEYGSTWTTSLSLPAQPAFGTGMWTYAQLIKAGEYVTLGGTTYSSADTNKGEGLDDHFPYTIHNTDGIQYNDGDSPNLQKLTSLTSPVKLTSSFRTYLMFQPPGNDVRWVQLSESFWCLNFGASLPGSGSWLDFPPSQSVGPVSLIYDFDPQSTPPSWTQIIPTNDSFNHS